MQIDHCSFLKVEDGCLLKPLCEAAMKQIRVNGKPLDSMEGIVIQPNTRVCIGPSAIFLYKNKLREEFADMPDPEDDPISFDFASEECVEYDTKAELSTSLKAAIGETDAPKEVNNVNVAEAF